MGKHVTEVDAIPRHFYQKAMHHLSTERNAYAARHRQAREALEMIVEFCGEVNRGPLVTTRSMAEMGLKGKGNEGQVTDLDEPRFLLYTMGVATGVGLVFIAWGAMIWLK
jgi:hypothetical protein